MAPVTRYLELENGDKMPIVGFGTWQASEEELEAAVLAALEAGYRHIDAARAYDNEAAIGRAIKKWVSEGKGKREDLFITTKLPPGGNRPDLVEQYFEESRGLLQLEYLDLYLLHVPFAFQHVPGDLHPKGPDGSVLIDKTTNLLALWKSLEKLVDSGRVRNIGLSNCNTKQVERIIAAARIRPACLQVEVHALFQQRSLLPSLPPWMPVVAYSPLGSRGLTDMLKKDGATREYPDLMSQPAVLSAAAAHGRTPAQVLLRHTVQRGIAVIPKSTNAKRLRENIEIFDFELSPAEVAAIDALDLGEAGRICDFTFFKGIKEHPEFPF